MCDGSNGSTVFLKSIDASDKIKDYNYIYQLLKKVIKDVGREYIVKVVTDNGSALKNAGRKLMRRFNIFIGPCVPHTV